MYLIIGCGFLGSCIADVLSKSTDDRILATMRNIEDAPEISDVEFIEFDVQNEDNIKNLKENTIGEKLKVFYLAAMHNIDKVYEFPDEAKKINADALKNFLESFDNIERLIYSSTDCVYGENIGNIPSKENDELKPVSEYGKQKALAEKIVNRFGFTAARLPLMVGPTPCKKKGFYDNSREKLLSGQALDMLDGYLRSALSYMDTAELLVALMQSENPLPPAVNVCSDNKMTKYDLGIEFAKKFGVSADLINKLPEEKGNLFYKDARAKSGLMDNSLLKEILKLDKIIFEL